MQPLGQTDHLAMNLHRPAFSARFRWFQESAGRTWCLWMHDSPMWPIHGRYGCRTCGRQYDVPWTTDRSVHEWHGAADVTKIEPAIVRSFRSALLPMVVMLLVAHSTIVRAADLPVVHDATPTLGSEDTKGKAY